MQMNTIERWMIIYNIFFQAEDGIRDLTVTGVQTCALPICPRNDTAGTVAYGCGARIHPVTFPLPRCPERAHSDASTAPPRHTLERARAALPRQGARHLRPGRHAPDGRHRSDLGIR